MTAYQVPTDSKTTRIDIGSISIRRRIDIDPRSPIIWGGYAAGASEYTHISQSSYDEDE